MAYRGQVLPLPLAVDGLYGVKRIPVTGLLRARNITLEANLIEKWGGATNENAAALPADILAGYDWWPDPSTQRFIAVLDTGVVRRDTGGWDFANTITTATTPVIADRPPMLVAGGQETATANRKLFLFTGNSRIQVLSGDGLAMTNIATPSADWTGSTHPTTGTIHEGRLFVLMGHTIYWSMTTNHENFTGAGSGSLPVYPGVGRGCRALVSLRKMLIIFKDRGIFIMDTSDATPTNWRIEAQSYAVGAAGPHCAVAIPNDVLFLDTELNFHLLSATNIVRDAMSSNISAPKLGPFMRDNFSPARAVWAQARWYGDKSQAWITLSAFGQTVNNRMVIVDFNNPTVGPRFTWSDRDVGQSLVMRELQGVERPYIGTDDGFIQRLDRSERHKNNTGYIGQFQLEHTDLSEIAGWPGRDSIFDFLEFAIEGVGNYPLLLNIYVNGELRTPTPLEMSLSGGGAILGAFILGVDRLGEVTPQVRRIRLFWRGRHLAFEGYNSGVNQTFRIRTAYVGMRQAG